VYSNAARAGSESTCENDQVWSILSGAIAMHPFANGSSRKTPLPAPGMLEEAMR